MWVLSGFLSVLFTVITLSLTARKRNGACWASLCALSFTAVTLLLEYKLVLNWVLKEDWAALMDVVPTMFTILTGYVLIQILLNAAALGLGRKKRSAG